LFGYAAYEKYINNYRNNIFFIQSKQEKLNLSDVLHNSTLLIVENDSCEVSKIFASNMEYDMQDLEIGLKRFLKGYIHSRFGKLEYIYSEISSDETLVSITAKIYFINEVLYQSKTFFVVWFLSFLSISILMVFFNHHPFINKKRDLLLDIMYNVFVARNIIIYFFDENQFFGFFFFSFEFWTLFLFIAAGYLFFIKISLPRYLAIFIVLSSFIVGITHLAAIIQAERLMQLQGVLYHLFLIFLFFLLIYRTYCIFWQKTTKVYGAD
jgi:hypothetical protein